MNPLEHTLGTLKVLFRQADTMALWGLPYLMHPGQGPRDLLMRDGDPLPLSGWIYLGSPGWWGTIHVDDRPHIQAFLEKYKDNVPMDPNEWDVIGS